MTDHRRVHPVARTGRAMQRRALPNTLVTLRSHLRPTRVLMTADCVGGVWTYALDLARGLAAEGVEIVLATMGSLPTPLQRAQAARIPGLTLCASSLKLEWMPDCWDDVTRAGEWLLELDAQFAPDVVHLNGYAHAALPWQCPTLVVAHSCVLSWWQAVKNQDAPSEWEIYREEVTIGVQAADCLVAPTRAMLGAVAHHYGPLFHSDVIPNGRQSDLYRAGVKEPFILTAGRVWDEAKNVALLERVAPDVDWPVYVAGSPQVPVCDASDTTDPADSMGGTSCDSGTSNFRPLGLLSAEDLVGWYARAAIYALPARYEPFGLSALEAALSGCALVLGDIPSLREVWGEAALYVSPDDADKLRRTLAALVSSSTLRQDMADRARQRAQRYSLRAMTEAYLDIYGQLMTLHAADPFFDTALPAFDTEESAS